ncbi:MAG: DUF5107 domain-containing protein [Lachnospiraceae bacterium]|nr:DUF5107 domain-containing protein [Lachnospiraceae bacterium]
MSVVKVWEEKVIIPTYEIGEPEKNPVFIDKRVYQGSSGKVYPYPTIEKIKDEKVNKEYKAVYLENEYLKVMVLPELGGRIQRAYDKTNNYDFVYYNHVIKPALVGLLGPWISGGIEFNWPQHHRPTTYLPVDYITEENADGSKSVLVHDVDQINGTKGIAKFTLYPGKAYIEITGQLYNRTPLPQTFLWWANPAVPVNDYTQSIFPPDVHAVMDHGKRDVSRFPIATGVYYKKDYSEGVDISRYKNIPVPTSYMAEKSKYDFVGGYDYQKCAGILHVADHHFSPGKKQWTWGCGDFGKAWDRNLTDEDGPYVELMTGVYTDNQPDFTWLKPFEEKTFKQYFMPYKAVGQVKNATIDAAVNLFTEDGKTKIIAYATGKHEAKVTLSYNGSTVFEENTVLSPTDIFEKDIDFTAEDETKLNVCITENGKVLVAYTPEEQKIEKLPLPAEAIGEPEDIPTVEELYLAGLHIEQYRHATYLPDPYYIEALKRDPGDIRANNAYGSLLMRRGNFKEAKKYLEKALERMTRRSPNPYTSEAYYNLGLAKFYLGEYDGAYDDFFKATWSNEQQEMSFYYLAAIDARKGRLAHALEMVEKGLVKNAHNIKARGLKVYILRKLGMFKEAGKLAEENLLLDPFDFVSGFEKAFLSDDSTAAKKELDSLMRGFVQNYLMSARDYAEAGAYEEALLMLAECKETSPLVKYYEAYYLGCLGRTEEAGAKIKEAEAADPAYCFPNKLEDILALRYAVNTFDAGMAAYYLGCLFYDKLQRTEAIKLWEKAATQYPGFATVHRNLALAYYNNQNNKEAAKAEMEKAFALDTSDVRVFLELDQLYKKLGYSFAQRLEKYEEHRDIIEGRDDLFIEYITLNNMTGRHQKAYDLAMGHKFHTWEGGEGKITMQYTLALVELAKQALINGDAAKSEELLHKTFVYPENLGEGKLEGTKDNHVFYNLGLALEAQGMEDKAKECYEKATYGTDEPAGMMYYNDQPADMIMYQGLAKQKLGKTAEAKSRFYRLIDYGEKHLWDETKIEYFAVSLPEFQIFNEDYTARNKAHCYYLMGLGRLGLGEVEKAKEFFHKALRIEPSHMFCTLYLSNLEKK